MLNRTSQEVIKQSLPKLATFLKHFITKPFQVITGTFVGINAAYDVGSAVEGEHVVDGKHELKYCHAGMKNKDLIAYGSGPDLSVVFSLVDSKEVTLSQATHPNSILPFHAGNTNRGLLKSKNESGNIFGFAIASTILAGYVTKNFRFLISFPLQTAFVTGSTLWFGAHRGNVKVGIPSSLHHIETPEYKAAQKSSSLVNQSIFKQENIVAGKEVVEEERLEMKNNRF